MRSALKLTLALVLLSSAHCERECASLRWPGAGSVVLYDSLLGAVPQARTGPPFTCHAHGCPVGAGQPKRGCPWSWDGASTVACGASSDTRGFEDVVVGLSVGNDFFSRLERELGPREHNGSRANPFLHVPGVWFGEPGFKKASLLLVSEAYSRRDVQGRERPVLTGPGTVAQAAELRAAGVIVKQVNFSRSVWEHNVSRKTPIQTLKTREMFRAMWVWRPQAQYFLKLDTDTVLFPAQLLLFLRTLEAAVGVNQPLHFGSMDASRHPFAEGNAYGVNAAALRALVADDSAMLALFHNSSGMDFEDRFFSATVAAQGAALVHCSHFFARAEEYFNPASPRGKSARPISLHKARRWREMRSSIPDGICTAPPPAGSKMAWAC